MKNEVEGLLLAELWETCYRAHTWTSFSPDKRATQYVVSYSEMLENDLKELGENQGNYKDKFIQKFKEWMISKSNCASSMITGGANFNVVRNEKALNAERNKCEAFSKWREKYFKAVNRERTLSPEEELDNALLELDSVSNRQAMMKEINAHVRKNSKVEPYGIIQVFRVEGYPNELIDEVAKNYETGYGLGFPRFTLTNNNAKIKRLTDKVNIMRNRIERKNNFEDVIFEGGKATIEDDRVKIFHDEKPSNEVIQELKSKGFRWSPHWKCWCRKHTANAIYVMEMLSFIRK